MYYVLGVLLFFIVLAIFVRLLRSLLRGCVFLIAMALLIFLAVSFVRSKNKPVTILNSYVIDNYKVRKLP